MNDSAAQHRALIERYFQMVQSGDPEIGALFCEDVVWIAPQSSPVGRRHAGKSAVLALMGTGIGLYDADQPMQFAFDAIAAEGDVVFVEMTLEAKTRAGLPYLNHYVFVFRMRDGKISEVREHLDTFYAQRLLFDPAGQSSPLDTN